MADFEVMLAKPYDPKRVVSWKEMYVDAKLNGVRVIGLANQKNGIRYFSRNGRELGMFTHLDPSVRKLWKRMSYVPDIKKYGLMIDTEAMGVTFGDVSGAIHTKGTVALTCRLHVFHAMPLPSFLRGYDDESQRERMRQLEYVIDTDPIQGLSMARHRRVLDHAQVMKAHKEFRKIDPNTGLPKFEGTMVKNMDVAWTASRSWNWMKIKDEETADIIVTGIKEGKGKYKGMVGALICDYKGRKVSAGGMPDELREKWAKKPKLIIGKMIEVAYQEETEHGSLRHIRFTRVRDDKQEA